MGNRKLVRSVPGELNKDHGQILELAQVCLALGGFVEGSLLSTTFIEPRHRLSTKVVVRELPDEIIGQAYLWFLVDSTRLPSGS